MGKKYEHLRIEERTMIQLGLEQGCTLRAIARSVQRSPSTVTRELARNGWTCPGARPIKRGRPPVAGGYRAAAADGRARRLAAMPRCASRLATDGPLWPIVEDLLRQRHSPEQIAGILARMHPDRPTLQASHETIYTAIYAMPRGELRSELIACLRQSRKTRRPRTRGTDRRGTIPHRTSIHERPVEVEERLVPGHWEGDLIQGARNASAIGTLVERTTLFVTLAKMENASAEAAVAGFGAVLNRIEAQRRLSMTYDQGREMAQPCRNDRQRRLFRRSAQPLAARHQREHQWPAAPVFPERHQPVRLLAGSTRCRRLATQLSASKKSRLEVPRRTLHAKPLQLRTSLSATCCTSILKPPTINYS